MRFCAVDEGEKAIKIVAPTKRQRTSKIKNCPNGIEATKSSLERHHVHGKTKTKLMLHLHPRCVELLTDTQKQALVQENLFTIDMDKNATITIRRNMLEKTFGRKSDSTKLCHVSMKDISRLHCILHVRNVTERGRLLFITDLSKQGITIDGIRLSKFQP